MSAKLYALGLTQLELLDSAQAIGAFLAELPGWDYADPRSLQSEASGVRLYLDGGEDPDARLAQIRGAMEELLAQDWEVSLGPLTVETALLREEDWSHNWKKYYKPIPVGKRLLIKPAWEELADAGGRLVLEIESGVAFGTGDHETTKLCLMMLEEWMRPGARVIDVGCGTGILAIAAALLGAADVLAVDLDPVSVRAARTNIALNRLTGKIRLRQGDLCDGLAAERADFITVNIVADVVIRFLAQCKPLSLLAPGARIACSGIILDRLEDVLAAAAANGFRVLASPRMGEWAGVLLQTGDSL